MDKIFIGKTADKVPVELLLKMSNRHGLITGATGTGKTVTLQTLAESFSRAGVSVVTADVKGDLSGLARPGSATPRVAERRELLGVNSDPFEASPSVFWDLYAEAGHPVRTTISEMGPLLLAELLELNDTQEGVLNIVFRAADEAGLLLLDLKDLQAMLNWVGENAAEIQTKYGNVTKATIGAIQRSLLRLEDAGAKEFFGEPAIKFEHLMQRDFSGRGVISILDATKLINSPRLYATFLLWLLSELFEELPEVGDIDKPKLVFFFDEAHLLFDIAPKPLLEKIEQVVRLVRSKGVGVYFITQHPQDIPDSVLGQLGNRFQHALRAFTPKDQKAVRVAAESFRANPKFETESEISMLGVGEALVSVLDEKGIPSIVEKVFIVPPHSRLGALTPEERKEILGMSPLKGVYDETIDRNSAYEMLQKRAEKKQENIEAETEEEETEETKSKSTRGSSNSDPFFGKRQGILESFLKSTVRTVGTQIGRQLVRGALGSLLGGSRR